MEQPAHILDLGNLIVKCDFLKWKITKFVIRKQIDRSNWRNNLNNCRFTLSVKNDPNTLVLNQHEGKPFSMILAFPVFLTSLRYSWKLRNIRSGSNDSQVYRKLGRDVLYPWHCSRVKAIFVPSDDLCPQLLLLFNDQTKNPKIKMLFYSGNFIQDWLCETLIEPKFCPKHI